MSEDISIPEYLERCHGHRLQQPCPRCGSKLSHYDDRTMILRYCVSCGKLFPNDPALDPMPTDVTK